MAAPPEARISSTTSKRAFGRRAVSAEVVDHDLRAARGEPEGVRAAEAGARAGDDGDPSVKPDGHGDPLANSVLEPDIPGGAPGTAKGPQPCTKPLPGALLHSRHICASKTRAGVTKTNSLRSARARGKPSMATKTGKDLEALRALLARSAGASRGRRDERRGAQARMGRRRGTGGVPGDQPVALHRAARPRPSSTCSSGSPRAGSPRSAGARPRSRRPSTR